MFLTAKQLIPTLIKLINTFVWVAGIVSLSEGKLTVQS